MNDKANNNRNVKKRPHSQSTENLANNEKRSKLSFNRIQELAMKDPDAIMLELMNPKFGIDEYMETTEMGDEFILLFTQSIEKALYHCNSMRQNKLILVNKLSSSHYLKNVLYKAISKKEANRVNYNIQLIKSAINICNSIMTVIPVSGSDIEWLIDRIEIMAYLRTKDKDLMNEFEEKIRKLKNQEINEQTKILSKQSNSKINTFTNTNDHLEAPNKIADIPITPILSEINNYQKPFLRKNIINGPYKCVSHYLDIHFRLLREDFMQPLRKGINEFKSLTKNSVQNISKEVEVKLNSIESLYVYQNVKFLSNLCIDSGVAYTIRLDLTKTKNVNWEISKRLLYGSLLCLSNDNFKNNLIVATILDRDTEKLKNGVISIKVESNTHEDVETLNSNYIMLETSAYFEAYRHVLTALQDLSQIDENNFPFKEEIVQCIVKDMGPPKYLENASIDFRPIVDETMTVKIDSNTGISEYKFSPQSDYAKGCRLSNEMQWPTSNQMHLDESQYAALKLGLTKKIALIQGPPGTGKTFIGVKLVQILLHNRRLWWNTGKRPKPILMICFTNHALDQFLELCVKKCHINSGIVRIGGRCKNSELEGFLLRNIKEKVKGERKIDSSIFFQLKDNQKKLFDLQQKINIEISYLNLCEEGILKLEALSNIIPPIVKSDFSSNNDLLDWLGFTDISKSIFDFKKLDSNFQISNKFNGINNKNKTEKAEYTPCNEDFDDPDNDNDRMLEEDIYVTNSSNRNNENRLNFGNMMDRSYEDEFIFTEKDIKIFIDTCTNNKDSDEPKSTSTNFYQQGLCYYQTLLNLVKEKIEHKNKVTESVWTLHLKDRVSLYSFWVHCFKEKHKSNIHQLKDEYNNVLQLINELKMQEDRVIMQNAFVIAMTTTGSARYHTILKDLGPKIVIVEEAAEVFEAHVVSALSKNCEHLILIGDHVQLRPKPNVYELERNYRLDVSLFERLLTNGCKHVSLKCQHRMRPEISILMKHFYNFEIKNHDSIYRFENIKGIKKNIFFISHNYPEETYHEAKSHYNKHEMEYLIKLLKYLMKQRYNQSQITILTTYLGQMFFIREELRKSERTKNVKICTIDNYQGEENDIILLSLVRSNNYETIGFLAIENRICVALSRARKGLYCIGNFNLLKQTSAKHHTKWSQIIETLKETQSIGTGLPLSCGHHPKNDIIATDPSDFDKRPEGGCNSGCEYRLKCGHVCSYFCHTYDPDHEMIKCKKKCHKAMSCGHTCTQNCGHDDLCDRIKCRVELVKQLECGHKEKLPCYQSTKTYNCRNKCSKKLECGHHCTKLCSVAPCGPCLKDVSCNSICTHESTLKVSCYLKNKIWHHQELCNEPCSSELECGHLCTFKCGECFGGRIHKSCVEKCDRNLICGHKCKMPCAQQCPPCMSKCENRCSHSYCPEKCSAPCKPCREPCSWKCIHKKCTKLCYEICDRTPCEIPCKKLLKKCNHNCVGFCGEPCPPLCKICDKDQLTEIFFGNEDDPNARFVLLEDCGHIFESTGLTDWMAQCVQGSSEDQSVTIKLPECPRCKTPIRRNLRYSSYVKRQLQAIEVVKNKISGTDIEIQAKKVEFIQFMNSQENSCEDSRIVDDIIKEANLKNNLTTVGYYTLLNKWRLYNALKKLERKTKRGQDKELEDINCLVYEFQKIKNLLLNSKCVDITKDDFKNRLTNQKINQINDELERIKCMHKYFCCKYDLNRNENKKNDTEISSLLQYLDENLIRSIQSFKYIEKEIKEVFNKLQSFVPSLSITEDERLMILKAMNLKLGHWYQCPNQHVYCITECGGAMEKSRCPECGEEIGGSNHALLSSNTVATAMDGAEHSAWSNYMNDVNDFDIDEDDEDEDLDDFYDEDLDDFDDEDWDDFYDDIINDNDNE